MIKEEQKLSEKILDYLRKHPGAGDTAEGITSWWLDMDTDQPSIEKVNHALEILVKKGLIKKRPLHGGTILYTKGSRSVGRWQKVRREEVERLRG
ncbi:MAG: hypothetical protein GTO45_24245 [Candidatus Aminicenantes bacterium]|nr:hypothetical protein [Candidatus Aminicenantes bacterium]NIM81864.1 hypothetical protein [Candidatus Aminicenantes bacterium]NIN21241.1 hypothetical protein [Candidatus Aminicenantes bacterium]NIN45062.1 hypothetical protein [Candidatus Aminicenantes bacterium]NIN87879.1 hypothetical protein [Candidatus Aminicenantes bacterium]